MPNRRHLIARSLADRLFAAEEALDLAAARIAELNAALPLARLDAKVAALVGQDAIRRSAKAVMLVARTRQEVVATHACLQAVGEGIGLQEHAYGDLLKPPPAKSASDATHLRSVG